MTSIMTGTDGAVFTRATHSGKAYSIAGSSLSMLTGESAGGSLIMINDVTTEDRDVALPVVAVDDKRVLFKFGKDFGAMEIRGRVYLGNSRCGNKALRRKLEDAFDQARLSKVNKPTKVSVAQGKAYPVYPITLAMGDTDAQTNSFQFVIKCIIAPD